MKRIVKIFAIIFFIFILSGCSNNVFDKNKILICDSENEKVDSTQQTDIQIKIEQEMRFDKIRKEKRLRELQNKKEAYENITFEYEYIKNSDEISYGFFTPSIVKYEKNLPLIIWLHGRGEVGCSAEEFAQKGGVDVLNKWSMQGFPAYIACPHLSSGVWNNQEGKDKVMGIVDYLKKNYPIDENRVYIVGHSLGAQGALYMVQKESIFNAVGLLSPYPPYTEIVNKGIPIKAFVGMVEYGEDKNSVDYSFSDFSYYYGKENLMSLSCSHGEIPAMVFLLDDNKDNNSDFFDWLLKQ